MKISQLCNEAHKNAKNKGFWDDDSEIGTQLMLIVSELAEALEADRTDRKAEYNNYKIMAADYTNAFETYIKDSFEDEIADAFIRLGDLCGKLNIDITEYIRLKMRYNRTRKKKHGKKY